LYGILGDDESDVETLKVLVRRLARNEALPVKTKGYGGCAKMLHKGAKQLALFKSLECTRFIVCYDADGPDPKPKHDLVRARIVAPSGIDKGVCIVIPVQEIEAWLLADIECATKIFTSWKPTPITNPEQIPSPKEYLEKLSRDSRQRPRYSHAAHNEKMAKYIDLRKVSNKCSAFRVLAEFVTGRRVA
jgi:hypothetical protein